jgi:hypothetical protein
MYMRRKNVYSRRYAPSMYVMNATIEANTPAATIASEIL